MAEDLAERIDRETRAKMRVVALKQGHGRVRDARKILGNVALSLTEAGDAKLRERIEYLADNTLPNIEWDIEQTVRTL